MSTNPGRVPAVRPGLVSRRVGPEFVVLDTDTDQAHSLTGPAAAVWAAALDGIEPDLPSPEHAAALEALVAAGLLAGEPAGPSRRALLQRAGVIAVGVGVASVALPEAVAAASSVFDVTYTTSQTIVIPANARAITITVNGAAGGSSGANSSGSTTAGGYGGDGGAAVWSLTNAPGSPITVLMTIGQGGAKGGSTLLSLGGAPGGAGYDAGGTGGRATAGLTANALVYSNGGGGGGSTGVNLSGGVTGTLVGAGGGGGAGTTGYGGDGGDAGTAAGTVSLGYNGVVAGGGTRPTPNVGGIGGGQTGNAGTPVTTAGGSTGGAGASGGGSNQFGGGGGGGGVVSGTGGIPFQSGTTTYSMGGGGGESYGSVSTGTVAYGTGALGGTGVAGANGSVRVRYIA